MSRNKAMSQQSLADAAAAMSTRAQDMTDEEKEIAASEAAEAKREALEAAAIGGGATDGDLTDVLQRTLAAKQAEVAAKSPPAAKAPPKVDPPPFATRGGRIRKPRRTIIYGEGGSGKTTLAADIDGAIFVDCNNGTESLDVQRFVFRADDALRGHVPRTWEELRGCIKLLRETAAQHKFKVVVFEVMGDIEQLALRHIIKRDDPQDGRTKGKGLESYGFGAGKQVLLDEMRVFFNDCDGLVSRGIDVVITAHAVAVKFNNPKGPDFDQFHIACISPLVGPYAYGWADEVGFLHFDDVAVKAEGKRGKNKGLYTGKRILEFDHDAAWKAKARLPFPQRIVLPSGRPWEFYRQALTTAYSMTAVDLRAEIDSELERIGDPELNPKVKAAVGAVGDNTDRLTAFMQDLRRRPAKEREEDKPSRSDDED